VSDDTEQTDPAALRALACAVLENAVTMATSTAGWIQPAERKEARRFLLDPEDRRLESWVSVLGLDVGAIREAMRARLRAGRGGAA